MKKLTCLILILALCIPTFSVNALGFSDVPSSSWAAPYIRSAESFGLMSGVGDGNFGYGQQITRGEFVTILCRMMKYEILSPLVSTFSDVPMDKWYFSYVETALFHEIIDKSYSFRPGDPILRDEMAVMLVRALGLSDAARLMDSTPLSFTDVKENKGYIAVALDIGMTTGTSATTFSPKSTATREEAAAMLVRINEKLVAKSDFLHSYYAFSSFSQKELTQNMDAVTLGWSAFHLENGQPKLSTTASDTNRWFIPASYENITSYLENNGTKAHLGVYMDSSTGVKDLLLSPDNRASAVSQIMNELNRTYSAIGKNPYSGVSIDFEGLKGQEVKEGFNAFLSLLSKELKAAGKTLYVAVQPVLRDSEYFDGFDYKTIGTLADKVVLMAHDYNPTSLKGFSGTSWHKNTPLTPISSVYHSLKAATDPNTGVEDKSKLVLAISFSTIGWEVSAEGKLLNESPVKPDTATVHTRLTAPGTVKGYSSIYRNPYLQYTTEEGKHIFLWYEDAQSVGEKAALARLFGINGLSMWRLGTIPDYPKYTILPSLFN